jgi:Family of unknown function (DUF6641)
MPTPHMKSLKFIAAPRGGGNPVLARRAKLVSRLEDQIALARDPNYAHTQRRRVKGEDGTVRVVDVPRVVRPWWRTDSAGALVFSARYGFKPIEWEKGKSGIAVPSKDKLENVIETLIAAVQAGELDEILARHLAAQGGGAKKRAA